MLRKGGTRIFLCLWALPFSLCTGIQANLQLLTSEPVLIIDLITRGEIKHRIDCLEDSFYKLLR
jgi:hypothetical protein